MDLWKEARGNAPPKPPKGCWLAIPSGMTAWEDPKNPLAFATKMSLGDRGGWIQAAIWWQPEIRGSTHQLRER